MHLKAFVVAHDPFRCDSSCGAYGRPGTTGLELEGPYRTNMPSWRWLYSVLYRTYVTALGGCPESGLQICIMHDYGTMVVSNPVQGAVVYSTPRAHTALYMLLQPLPMLLGWTAVSPESPSVAD